MKIFAIATTILLANVAYAAPALVEACNPASVGVKFIGLGEIFVQYFPADGSIQKIPYFYTIQIEIIPPGYSGTFSGIAGSFTYVDSHNPENVTPPQAQVEGSILPEINQILCV